SSPYLGGALAFAPTGALLVSMQRSSSTAPLLRSRLDRACQRSYAWIPGLAGEAHLLAVWLANVVQASVVDPPPTNDDVRAISPPGNARRRRAGTRVCGESAAAL